MQPVDNLAMSLNALSLDPRKNVAFAGRVNAHNDDIHALVSLTPTTFVTGSKDSTVKVWDFTKKTQTPCRPLHGARGYKSWITACAAVDEDTFVTGTRDGYIDTWTFEGQSKGSIAYDTKLVTKSKDRNKLRIHCVAKNTFGAPGTFFTGASGCFLLWDSKEQQAVKNWVAHANDWVYCIEPLTDAKLLVVIGSTIEVWDNIYSEDIERSPLLQEVRKAKQRPHVSAIIRLEHASHVMPCALFDGSVRIVDIEAQQVIRSYDEHKNRVWTVKEVKPSVIATGADDTCIKLWDVRLKNSLATIPNNPGRVSCILKLNDEQFISASCPDDVFNSTQKATITYWNINKLL